MGRKKKRSVRCKTSKREHKHINRKLEQQKKLRSPSWDRKKQKRIPLNKIIDSHGKSAEFIHSKLLKQNKIKRKARNKTIKISPANKLKIDTFLFGSKSRPSRKTNKDKENDDNDNDIDIEAKSLNFIESDIESDDEKTDNEDLEKFDVIKISNLDQRVLLESP